MPTLSATQDLPPVTLAASLSVAVQLSAGLAIPAPVQTATLAVEPLPPDAHFTAAQMVPAPRQAARLRVHPGPAVPRAERAQATPRQ